VHAGTETVTADGIQQLKKLFDDFMFTILGIKIESKDTSNDIEGLMQLIIDIRTKAKGSKDFQTADQIRDTLTKLGIAIKDNKDGVTWNKM
jgi:cysteinyl-tRNA synthetase